MIAGAAGSLGRVVARDQHERGSRLGLLGSRAERLEEVARDLALRPEEYVARAADLRDEAAASAAIAAVVDRFGRLDAVVHVVGGWTGGGVLAEDARERLGSMLDQHLWSTFAVARAAVPTMVAAGRGRIVAVSSPAAADPPGGMAGYAVAKAAQEALLRSLARELHGSGVTANVLLVREIASPGGAPAKGSTRPEAIAAAIRWLCSDEGGAVNGQRIALFGG